ncbi:hypothetical protein OR37_03864 [Caulobacter vibrioides OR37]|uniref:UPF0386 protein OR37_03864 n=1 Tax=Caulobacter vibrioides OR37 TaxID=1292034 RepID=R0CV57_CAUVI|nr:hypothetical protein OR37_03864 [Caulobacter vibrioides OR37]
MIACLDLSDNPLNISKPQQRVLHALAQGGRIELERDEKGRVVSADCYTRDGWALTDGTVAVFQALKRKKLIASRDGGPYRITRLGLGNLRAQLDNRVGAKAW